jgi:CheY-like chemotaxis protein
MNSLLVVNDHPIFGLELKEALEQSVPHFHVELTSDAASAIQLAQRGSFDLIQINLGPYPDMPIGNHREAHASAVRLLRELRANGVQLPIQIREGPVDDFEWKSGASADTDVRPLKYSAYYRRVVTGILAQLRRVERQFNIRRSTPTLGPQFPSSAREIL